MRHLVLLVLVGLPTEGGWRQPLAGAGQNISPIFRTLKGIISLIIRRCLTWMKHYTPWRRGGDHHPAALSKREIALMSSASKHPETIALHAGWRADPAT